MPLQILFKLPGFLDSFAKTEMLGEKFMKKLIVLVSFLLCCIHTSDVFAEKQPIESGAMSFQFFVNPIASPDEAHIELFLINEGEKTLEFEAPTSQWYDFVIIDENDKIVYEYSKGKFFLQAIQRIILKPGETKIWIENVNLPSGKNLKPGKYKINAQLKATTLNGESIKGYHTLMDEAVMVVPPENPIIKNVRVNKEEGSMVVSGQARPTTGELFYVVEDGHQEWVTETKIKLDSVHPTWGDFSFRLNLPEDNNINPLPFILYIYEKDKSGNIIHAYPKLLD
jgi:hypothetical protein